MPHPKNITTLFVDIGGVLLTNGWDHLGRRAAAQTFHLHWEDMKDRHQMNFATHEEGKLTLADYLDRVVFHERRPFTRAVSPLHVRAIAAVAGDACAGAGAQNATPTQDHRRQQ